MTVQEFIKEYNDAQDKNKCIKKHIVNSYIPFSKKELLGKNIVNASCYKNVNGTKQYMKNSLVQYVLFSTCIIDNYTDIDLSQDKLQDFELLDSIDFFEEINKVLSVEISKFQTIISMIENDTYENDRSLSAIFDKLVEITGSILNGINIEE